jgi:hypothetical protein
VIVTVLPATVSTPDRDSVELFCAIAYCTDPLPAPLAGPVSVIHGTVLAALQPQPGAAVTATLPVDAAAATDAVVGVTSKVQGTPACVTVNVCPAIVIAPVRDAVAVFAATL